LWSSLQALLARRLWQAPQPPLALDLYPVLVALMQWGDRYAAGPAGPQALLTHRDCGEPVRLELTCAAGHRLASAREVTPLPGPGARKTA
jgi:hypothetical protein